MATKKPITFSWQQTCDLVQMIGATDAVKVTAVSEYNHVWRLDCEQNRYFLKIFTKDWYSDDTDEYPVEHEQGAYACLAAHDVPSARVALARLDCDNPLMRPFIITEQVPGQVLMALLENTEQGNRDALLSATGSYLRRIHDITFAYPGFVDSIAGPSSPLDDNGYQHDVWTATQKQKNTLAQLAQEKALLPPRLFNELSSKFSRLAETLSPLYQPPRFVLTNAQIDHIFLVDAGGNWQVTGCIDMEAASAGNSDHDLVYLAIQLAPICANTSDWWEPFFAGYGAEPDFALFQLQMLACADHNFRFGRGWSGTRGEILERIASAAAWRELFLARTT